MLYFRIKNSGTIFQPNRKPLLTLFAFRNQLFFLKLKFPNNLIFVADEKSFMANLGICQWEKCIKTSTVIIT